jgi:hypothetical protein
VPGSWILEGTEGQFVFAVSVIAAAFILTAVATWAVQAGEVKSLPEEFRNRVTTPGDDD